MHLTQTDVLSMDGSWQSISSESLSLLYLKTDLYGELNCHVSEYRNSCMLSCYCIKIMEAVNAVARQRPDCLQFKRRE